MCPAVPGNLQGRLRGPRTRMQARTSWARTHTNQIAYGFRPVQLKVAPTRPPADSGWPHQEVGGFLGRHGQAGRPASRWPTQAQQSAGIQLLTGGVAGARRLAGRRPRRPETPRPRLTPTTARLGRAQSSTVSRSIVYLAAPKRRKQTAMLQQPCWPESWPPEDAPAPNDGPIGRSRPNRLCRGGSRRRGGIL